jgi:hypothetical protein
LALINLFYFYQSPCTKDWFWPVAVVREAISLPELLPNKKLKRLAWRGLDVRYRREADVYKPTKASRMEQLCVALSEKFTLPNRPCY